MPWKNASRIDQRKQLVLALLARRETVGVICRRFGVSRQSAYKFWRRFLQAGWKGLRDQARGPKRKHTRRWSQVRQQLLASGEVGPRGTRANCCGGGATVSPAARGLRNAPWHGGCEPRVPCEPRGGAGTSAPPPLQPARRGRGSNEVWTIDWKGWIRTGDGSKIEPLTIWDLGSRFVLWTQPLARRSDAAVRQVCRRLFRRHGRPKAIRTDLGGPFCSTGPSGLVS